VILAGDIGGTNARLAVFQPGSRIPIRVETVPTTSAATLEELIKSYVNGGGREISAACFGVAGTVVNGAADGVNLPWQVDADLLQESLDIPVRVVNDLHANARGIEALDAADFVLLNRGAADRAGNRAVVSAGTGLGEAGLYWDGERHHAIATEGGHADFGPRTSLEVDLYHFLAAEYGHVSYERICSGTGLVWIYRFLSGAAKPPTAAAISAEALVNTRSVSSRALDLFISIYGARAGNVALGFMATGGVYLGGGIPPKILSRLQNGGFMKAFADKGRFSTLLSQIPVRVILNDKAALLGAARIATERPLSPVPTS
jgi:glucokinase